MDVLKPKKKQTKKKLILVEKTPSPPKKKIPKKKMTKKAKTPTPRWWRRCPEIAYGPVSRLEQKLVRLLGSSRSRDTMNR